MMIFNSFTVATDYDFGAQWPNGRGRRFTLALAGKFLQKELRFLFVFKIILWKRLLNLIFNLIYEQVNQIK